MPDYTASFWPGRSSTSSTVSETLCPGPPAAIHGTQVGVRSERAADYIATRHAPLYINVMTTCWHHLQTLTNHLYAEVVMAVSLILMCHFQHSTSLS